MELTVAGIVAFVTLLVGQISKKLGLEGKYIPLQNLGVGIASGCVCALLKLDGMDWITSLVTCVIASFGAGGLYDLKKTGEK